MKAHIAWGVLLPITIIMSLVYLGAFIMWRLPPPVWEWLPASRLMLVAAWGFGGFMTTYARCAP
jgi:hypothetical protein